MVISSFEIWVLQNFCSKNFKISKFWVCHFLTILKKHLLLEHISTLNSSLQTLFVKYVFFKILNFKILLKEYQNFKIPKNYMRQYGQKVNFPENFSFLASMTTELVSRQIFQQSYGHYWLFSRVFVKFSSRNFQNSKFWVWGHMKDSNTHKMTSIVAS
jgi:hypothetical protein